jgi:lipid-binding SYLF domain-containing protein
MLDRVIHEEVKATLSWLKTKDPGLGPELEKSYGYAVFPTMGRAGLLLVGGASGDGEVFERGKPVGLARLSQLTVGAQFGGQTFSELILFENKDALAKFKKGATSFMANASAVFVKAAAMGTSGTTTRAYSRGGLLLEASIGAQTFTFRAHEFTFLEESRVAQVASTASGATKPLREAAARAKSTGEKAVDEAMDTSAAKEGQRALKRSGRLARSARRIAKFASWRAGRFLKSRAKKGGRLEQVALALSEESGDALEKVKSTMTGIAEEATTAPLLGEAVKVSLARMKARKPGLAEAIERAHAYAVFPSIGRAAAYLGGAYGRGEVFERGKSIGHAAIVQMTIGMQLGGETFDELILFENADALDRFKSGKISFAANASIAILKAGKAAALGYAPGTKVFLHSEGGLILETALGGQKFIFRPKRLLRPHAAAE